MARERKAEWRKDPYLAALIKERRRRAYLKMREDPVKVKHYQDRHRVAGRLRDLGVTSEQREAIRERRRVRYVREQEALGRQPVLHDPADGRKLIELPAEPYRQWLVAFGEIINQRKGAVIAAYLGVEIRRVTGVLASQQPRVSAEIVDLSIGNARHTVEILRRVRRGRKWVTVLVPIFEIGDLYPDQFSRL